MNKHKKLNKKGAVSNDIVFVLLLIAMGIFASLMAILILCKLLL